MSTPRIFISYSRQNLPSLNDIALRLETHGFSIGYDTRSLPFGEDWKRELAELIRACDTIIWLVSEPSLVSTWCNWELTEVERLKKRLIPVVIEQIDLLRLPDAIARIQLFPASGIYDASLHFPMLVETLETDLEWVKLHSRLSDRAHEWASRGRPRDRLLRGRALADAEQWRDRRPEKMPAPANDTLELIRNSRRAATQRVGTAGAIAGIVAVGTIVLAGFAWQQRDVARSNAEIASLQRDVAVARLRSRESPIAGLRLIAEAAARNKTNAEAGRVAVLPEVHAGLFELLASAREQPPLGGAMDGLYADVVSIDLAEEGRGSPERLLIASREQVLVTDLQGRVLQRPTSGPDLAPAYANAAIWFGSGKYAVATGEFQGKELVNPGVALHDGSGKPPTRILADNLSPFVSLAYLRDAGAILCGDAVGNLYRIDIATLEAVRVAHGFGAALLAIAADDAGDRIVLAYGRAPPFTQPDPRPAAAAVDPSPSGRTFGKPESEAIAAALNMKVTVFALGTDGSSTACLAAGEHEVFACNDRGGVSVWSSLNRPDWPPFAVKGYFDSGRPTALSYSSDLKSLAIGDDRGRIRVWSKNGQPLTPEMQHGQGPVTALAFADHGNVMLSAGKDLSIRRWDLSDLSGGRRQESGSYSTSQSPDGSVRLAALTRKIEVLDARDRTAAPKRVSFDLASSLRDLQLSDRQLAVAGNGDRVAWALPDGVRVGHVGSPASVVSVAMEEGWSASLIALSHDGGRLAVVEQALKREGSNPFAPGRHRYAFYRWAGDVSRWLLVKRSDADTGQSVTAISAIPFSDRASGESDAIVFATGDSSGSVSFWNGKGERIGNSVRLSPTNSSAMAVERLAASGNGKLLLASLRRQLGTLPSNPTSDDFSHVALIALATREAIAPLSATYRYTEALALSTDGAFALIASWTGSLSQQRAALTVYNTAEMRPLGTIPIVADHAVPNSVWFDDVGKAHVATQFGAESAWPISFERLLQVAQQRVARWDSEDQYRALAKQASTASDKGDAVSARESLKLASQLRPDHPGPKVLLGKLLYDSLNGVGDRSAAAAAYDAAVDVNPFDILSRMQRGHFRYSSGDLLGAEQDYRAAVGLPMTYINPPRNHAPGLELNEVVQKLALKLRKGAHYEPWAFLGYAYHAQSKWADALSALSTTIAEFGGSARDRELRADAHAHLGDHAAALADLGKAFDLIAQNGGSYSDLDKFKGWATAEPARQRMLCRFSVSGVAWADRAEALGPAKRHTQVEWLRRAVTTCAKSWQAEPRPDVPGPAAIAAWKSRLAAEGIVVGSADEVALPLAEQLRRLAEAGDIAALEAFRSRYAAFAEAADAGRIVSRLRVKESQSGLHPDFILGTWQTSDGKQKIRIEKAANGGEVWRNLASKGHSGDDVIGETVATYRSAQWSHVGRHVWATQPPSWGRAGALVVDVISPNHLFYAYLDSRYQGGWLLERAR